MVAQGPKIRLGQFARAIRREDGKIVDNDDVVSGITPMRKGADAETALKYLHEKIDELNDHILPAGVKIVPFIDRSELVHHTTKTVLHNLTEGIILVVIILLIFLGNVRGAIIVALKMCIRDRPQDTDVTFDGAPAVRTRANGAIIGVANVDSTEEIQVMTADYAPEYGRAAGGQIRIVSKSGTRDFHGSLYEYLRNSATVSYTHLDVYKRQPSR